MFLYFSLSCVESAMGCYCLICVLESCSGFPPSFLFTDFRPSSVMEI